MTRFAVRWPAPDGGPSIGWRLTFWLLFCQEKSNKKSFPSREKEQIKIFLKKSLHIKKMLYFCDVKMISK